MHIRRKILEDLRTQLKTLPVFAGVWIQRIGPTRNAYPCITLAADSESIEYLTINMVSRAQYRTVSISITAWVRGTSDDEKSEVGMDAAAEAIESVLTLPANAEDIILLNTDFTVAEDEPEIHAVTLSYSVRYLSEESAAVI